MAKREVGRNGDVILLDDDIAEFLEAHGFAISVNRRNGQIEQTMAIIKLGRLICKPPKEKVVDHVNGNPLDNRRRNLRVCTQQQNRMNSRPQRNTSSKYKGVSRERDRNCWKAQIKVGKTNRQLGRFKDEKRAALAYDEAAHKEHKKFAWLNHKNFPEDFVGYPLKSLDLSKCSV
jgi:hypothetical protein